LFYLADTIYLKTTDTIRSINYPNNYPNDYDLHYIIPSPGASLNIDFEYYDIDYYWDDFLKASCFSITAFRNIHNYTGYLQINVREVAGGPLVVKETLTGYGSNKQYSYTTSLTDLYFATDEYYTASGFVFNYTIIPASPIMGEQYQAEKRLACLQTNPFSSHTSDFAWYAAVQGAPLQDSRTSSFVSPIVNMTGTHCLTAIVFLGSDTSIEFRQKSTKSSILKRCLT
jgi:hypothetical protein